MGPFQRAELCIHWNMIKRKVMWCSESKIRWLGFVKICWFHCSTAWAGEGERKNNSKFTDPNYPISDSGNVSCNQLIMFTGDFQSKEVHFGTQKSGHCKQLSNHPTFTLNSSKVICLNMWVNVVKLINCPNILDLDPSFFGVEDKKRMKMESSFLRAEKRYYCLPFQSEWNESAAATKTHIWRWRWRLTESLKECERDTADVTKEEKVVDSWLTDRQKL